LLKAQKFEWVLQKGTELGIAGFVPVLSSRSIIGSVQDVRDAKLERWQRIIAEAAEQSGRAVLPSLAGPMAFKPACQAAAQQGLALIPWEEERVYRLRQALDASPKHISLLIGPEGGFAAEEVATAREAGVVPVTLGPRILRAETAGLAAATAILYALGDFG
jgi:16S rRNA (uracil1498-N3)-methyltransferase